MLHTLSITLVSRMVDEATDAVMIIDECGMIGYINSAMHALIGFTTEAVLGQSIACILPDDVAAHHQQYLQGYLHSNKPSNVLGKVREFSIRHRTGEMIPIELKAVDLGMHHGKHYFGAFMIDLRARRQLEAQHAELLSRLEQQALCDPLTGLLNRRAFRMEAAQMAARAQRSATSLTVGMADVDHFKQINDSFGHSAGDMVLCEISRRIDHAARAADIVARVGGEEFGLLFPDAAPDHARLVAERIREAIAGAPVTTPAGDQLNVTISIGLAGLEPGAALDDALAQADSALYLAKGNGRNRVEG